MIAPLAALVAELRALERAVTQGEWLRDKAWVTVEGADPETCIADCDNRVTAAFIAALRNAAPALMDAAERVVRLEAKLQAVAYAHQDACYRDQGEPCEVCDVLLFKSLSDFDVAALSEGDSK